MASQNIKKASYTVAMEWTKEHDVILLREMLGSDLFHSKKGSPERGKLWDEITDRLNSTQAIKFRIKDKRGTRDRWNLLQSKFKKKRREEQEASGIEVEEPDEKEQLIEELSMQEETVIETTGTKDKADREAAEDVRNKALERLGETKKRKKDASGNEQKEKKTRRSTGSAVEFLREKAQEELAIRRQDQQLQQQAQQQQQLQQQHMMQLVQTQNEQMQTFQQQAFQQQMQQNQVLMTLLQRIIPQ